MTSETLKDSGADLALFLRRHPWLTSIGTFIALCVVVFFCLEWRAEQRWQRYAAEARSRGVKLMPTDFARPKIPDEQNFAALPMMRKIFAEPGGTKLFELPKAKVNSADYLPFPKGNSQPAPADVAKGSNADLATWQDYFISIGFLKEKSSDPAHGVLQALEHFAPEFREWSEWRTRSQCRFPLDLTQGFKLRLPHLGPIQAATKVFVLRMRAHLAAGESAAAYADFQDALQAYRMLHEEPFLITGLVRAFLLRTLMEGVGDGLENRTWAPADLEKIQEDLSSLRLIDDWLFALESERGSTNATVESWLNASLRERRQILSENFGFFGRDRATEIFFPLFPRMIFRDNQLRNNHYLDELTARIDVASQTVNLDKPTPSLGSGAAGSYDRFYYAPFFYSAGVYPSVEARFVSLRVSLDETRLACALERFGLKHGGYPETLAELAPEFLAAIPVDPYSHAPYRYQRVGSTSFRLYGVGENRTDEGGTIVPGVPERKQLDAVWPYAPAPSVP